VTAEALPEEETEPPATDVPLRHNRNFRLLWIGQLLSDLGSEMGLLAYPLLVLYLSHSPVIAGAVGSATAFSAFIVRLPAGALADRHDRRRMMIVTDGVRAVVLAGLAVAVAMHMIDWEVVLVVALIDRVGDTLFAPASMATMPIIIPDRQLEDVWAATEARQFTAGICGVSLGGILFGLGRALPFVGDAISYGVSTVTSGMLRGEFNAKRGDEPTKGLWREAFQGFGVIWRTPILRAAIVQAPLINFVFTGVIATVTLALAYHGQRAGAIGLAQATIMAGGLLGAIVAPRLKNRLTLTQLIVLLCGGGTVCLVVASILIPSPFVAIPIAIPFFFSPVANAVLLAAMFRQTPAEYLGRVNNALIQVATGLATLSPLVAGLLVANLSPHGAMAFFAVGLGVCLVVGLSLKGLREAERLLAEAA